MLAIDFKFKRSMEGYPKVFKECVCKSKSDPSQSIKIRIQEMPEDLHDAVVEFMVKYYLPDEPLARTSNVVGEEDSLQFYTILFYVILAQNLSLVALREGPNGKDEIVGCQLYSVFSLDDPPLPELPGKAIAKLKRFLYDIKTEDVVLALNEYQHLQDWGLCVDPQFRGWGVGEQILRTSNDLAAHIGIRTLCTIFTVINSQVIAEKLGYQTINAFKYKEYLDDDGNVAFAEEKTEEVKLMKLTI